MRVPDCNGAGTAERSYPASEVERVAERSYPTSEVGAAAGTSYPTSEVRGGGLEELPHLQGVVAAGAQEGLEELFHVQDQEGQR